MKLSDVITLDETANDFRLEGISIDTRSIKGGELFFALNGSQENGEKYIENALNLGAKGVICENSYPNDKVFRVKNVFETYLNCVDKFYGFPQNDLTLIGVTGTNGKTSVTHMIASILNDTGYSAGIIGTLGAKWNGKVKKLNNTTPSYLDFVKLLSKMKKDGVKIVVCEVSAHAISQKRLGNIIFDVGIFTNLSQDHLDYFANMKRYGDTKMQFLEKSCKNCIVNVDTDLGFEIYKNNQSKTITYGLYNPADVFAINFEQGKNGDNYVVCALDEIYSVKSTFFGEFNRYNMLCAITACNLLGINNKQIENAIPKICSISGRFNVYKGEKTVIIDYAHTPDGLKNVLLTARKLTSGRIICVFGCGGDRDKSKRPIMGKLSEQYADIVVLTEDNSRSENVIDIINDILVGMSQIPIVIYSRKKAISYALKIAKSDDLVLIAGKGGENYIEKSGKRYSFSDEKEVKRLLFT